MVFRFRSALALAIVLVTACVPAWMMPSSFPKAPKIVSTPRLEPLASRPARPTCTLGLAFAACAIAGHALRNGRLGAAQQARQVRMVRTKVYSTAVPKQLEAPEEPVAVETVEVSRGQLVRGSIGSMALALAPPAHAAAPTWVQYDLNTGETLYDIDFDEKDPNHGFIVGARALFYETKDGGNRWVSRSFANLGKGEDISYRFQTVSVNGDEVWIVGKPPLLLHSKDGGKSWKKVPVSRKLPGEPKADGFGIHVEADGSTYEGQWIEDKAHGTGRLEHSDGATYDGNWRGSMKHGQGTYVHSDGSKYTGDWLNDLQSGNGSEEWSDGATYSGQYLAGRKNGKGKYTWPNGSYFEGQFVDNDIHGYGVYVWTDGCIYKGQWAKQQMDGEGIFEYPDGRKYEGNYVKSQKHGPGRLSWPDGRLYEGEFALGEMHGHGIMTEADGTKKEGVWKRGQRMKE